MTVFTRDRTRAPGCTMNGRVLPLNADRHGLRRGRPWGAGQRASFACTVSGFRTASWLGDGRTVAREIAPRFTRLHTREART